MPIIDLQKFGGRQPRVSPRLLQNHQAQTAENCAFSNGKVVAIKDPTETTDHGVLVPKTIWKMGASMIIFPDGEENTVVDSPVDESNNRIFWTDGSLPKQSDDTLWGEATWWRRLGVKPGAVAPTITVSGAAGDDVQDYVSYVFTMVTTWGEESAPSPASALATIMSDQYVDLSVMTTPATSYNTFEYKRIYRLSSGTQGAEYQFLAQIAYANTTYQDKAAGNALADVDTDIIETTDWALPPDTLKGLTQAHNGMLLGYDGKELYISEPNYPYAWPADYVRIFDTDIQGIGAFNQYIIVATKKYCYVLTGSHPLSLTKSKMGNPQGCLHDRGVVSTEFGVLYPSPDGLCLCDGQKVRVISKDWINKTDWLALNPDTLVSEWHDNQYFGFFQGTDDGLVYDIDTGEFATLNFTTPLDKIYDAYVDLESDTLYILCTNTAGNNGYTYSYATAGTYLSYTWTSKIFVNNHNFTCAKIEGDIIGSSLLLNGSFETGDPPADWATAGNANLDSHADPNTGTYCLEINGTGTAYPSAKQNITVIPGEEYNFSFFVKQGTYPDYYGYIYDLSNAQMIITNAGTATASWAKKMSNNILIPAGCTSVQIGLQLPDAGTPTTNILFDDISFALATAPTFEYYEDGSLTQIKIIGATTGLFRLPDTGYTKEKYFTLIGTPEIYRVQLATSPGEIE